MVSLSQTSPTRVKEPKKATTETSRANGGRQISTATRLDHRWNNNSVTGNCTPPIPVIQRPTSALLGRQPRVHSCDKTTKSGISVRGLPRDLLLEGWPALGTSPHYDDVQAATRDCRPLHRALPVHAASCYVLALNRKSAGPRASSIMPRNPYLDGSHKRKGRLRRLPSWTRIYRGKMPPVDGNHTSFF